MKRDLDHILAVTVVQVELGRMFALVDRARVGQAVIAIAAEATAGRRRVSRWRFLSLLRRAKRGAEDSQCGGTR